MQQNTIELSNDERRRRATMVDDVNWRIERKNVRLSEEWKRRERERERERQSGKKSRATPTTETRYNTTVTKIFIAA